MLRRFALFGLLGCLAVGLFGLGIGVAFIQHWEDIVVDRFRTHRWNFPSKIFADSGILYPGIDLDATGLFDRLARLGYQAVEQVKHRGEYHYGGADRPLEISLHQYPYPPSAASGRRVVLTLDDNIVTRIDDPEAGTELFTLELEPEAIGGMFAGTWEERRVVTLGEVSPYLLNAIIDVEDQHFYSHHGIDFRGVVRALLSNLRSGHIVQGGSTLTQQLMKNFFLSDERSLRRKVREAFMAVIVERRFSKEEILTNYVNEIYLGQRGLQGIHGVWEAARFYFAKDPAELSIAECATLAGLIKAPNNFSPFRNPERSQQRRDYALGLMLEHGHIDREQYAAALAEPLRTTPGIVGNNDAPYFVDVVRNELRRTYPADTLTSEGLQIYTTLDTRLQTIAKQVVDAGLADLERRHRWLRADDPADRLQACLIAVQPQTGAIKAMIGGREYKATQFNRCTQALRQPGSVFKPFTYLAAFEATRLGSLQILPTTILADEPFEWSYPGGVWSPSNYSRFFGDVTVRTALEHSLNAATARLAQQVGLRPILEIARQMGVESNLPPYPSVVLGAAEVTPFEIAQAYSVLANGGLRADLVSVKNVSDRGGMAIERNPIHVAQVVDPESAYLVTHLLEGVLDHGTAGRARRLGFRRPAAGKTGTTNDYNDAWFVGFTPELLTVVWVGFDRKRSLKLAGGDAAIPMWAEFMKQATKGVPETAFLPPPGIAQVRIDPDSGALATDACPSTILEAYFEDHAPSEACPLHSDSILPW